MARAQRTDFLSSMRFRVTCLQKPNRLLPGTVGPYSGTGALEAGFQDVQTPDLSVGEVSYKEGTWVYTKKYPGIPTVSNINMSRGVTKKDSTFLDWMKQTAEGAEYREDLQIHHYHRDVGVKNVAEIEQGKNVNLTVIGTNNAAAKVYTLYEAFPVTHKVATDLAASSPEVSIMNLTVAYEYFTVTQDNNDPVS